MEPFTTSAVVLYAGKKAIDALLSKKIPEWFSEISEKVREEFSTKISEYYDLQSKYYSEIKTILTSNSPKKFDKIYYPLSISSQRSFTNENVNIIKNCSINNVFTHSNYILIFGSAGSGKSCLIKHLFMGCIKENYSIPILIELRNLNNIDYSIKDFVIKEILDYKIKNSEKDLERILSSGAFTFFFDGYDEINPELQEKITTQLQYFIRLYNKNMFIITSRPYTNIAQMPQFHNYRVQDLEDEDIKPFTEQQISAILGTQHSKTLSDAVSKSILEAENASHIKSFMKNPLLLSLYILTFQKDASIPATRSEFYHRVINTLLSEHDSITKLGYKRSKKTNLSSNDLINIISVFSTITYFEAKFSWKSNELFSNLDKVKLRLPNVPFDFNDFITDMKISTSLWIEDSGEISFTHRSLQEYFTAMFIKNIKKTSKYNDIINKIPQDHSYGRYPHYNLFALCKELDYYDFTKLYQLPLLEEIYNKIKNLRGIELVECLLSLDKKFIRFFADGEAVNIIETNFNDKILESQISTSFFEFNFSENFDKLFMGDNGRGFYKEIKKEFTLVDEEEQKTLLFNTDSQLIIFKNNKIAIDLPLHIVGKMVSMADIDRENLKRYITQEQKQIKAHDLLYASIDEII